MNEKEPGLFSDEEIKSIMELGEVLRSIHARLKSEGVEIKNGKVIYSEIS